VPISDLALAEDGGFWGIGETGLYRFAGASTFQKVSLGGAGFDVQGDSVVFAAPIGVCQPTDDGGYDRIINYAGIDVAHDADGGFWLGAGGYVLRFDASGTVLAMLGDGQIANAVDGPASLARFAAVLGVATDPAGGVWITDDQNTRLRHISESGDVTTVAYLADSPGQLLVESPSSILVAVPGAILRVKLKP
jgi:hypothetical protein